MEFFKMQKWLLNAYNFKSTRYQQDPQNNVQSQQACKLGRCRQGPRLTWEVQKFHKQVGWGTWLGRCDSYLRNLKLCMTHSLTCWHPKKQGREGGFGTMQILFTSYSPSITAMYLDVLVSKIDESFLTYSRVLSRVLVNPALSPNSCHIIVGPTKYPLHYAAIPM